MCENGVQDGIVCLAPLLVRTTVSTKTCPPECIQMVQLGASKRIKFCSEMRRGWDSNPRNTVKVFTAFRMRHIRPTLTPLQLLNIKNLFDIPENNGFITRSNIYFQNIQTTYKFTRIPGHSMLSRSLVAIIQNRYFSSNNIVYSQ